MPPTSPFRGGLYSSSFCSCTMLFLSFPVGTGCAVSVDFGKGKSRWKRSTGTFPKSHNSKRQTGRSGLVRSALEKLSLFSPTFPVRQKHGAGSFAVCGQRLRGHVPSKNTSPAALSWSSLTSPMTPFLFASARWYLLNGTTGFVVKYISLRRFLHLFNSSDQNGGGLRPVAGDIAGCQCDEAVILR